MSTKPFLLMLATASSFLMSCGGGDQTNSSQTADDGSVQLYGAKVATTASSLPTCDSTQVGQLFYVLSDEAFQFCSSVGYQTIDLQGAVGADGKDGTDGTNGTNGADGSSCSVSEKANGSKTILCEDGTTATVSDGASCTVADNNDGSYDMTCSGTTVTVRDGVDGQDGVDGVNGIDGVSCLANKSNDSLFVDCNGVLDTIVDGQDGVDGVNGTSFHSGVGIPASNLGTNGDTYLDTYRTAYYLKISGNWVLQSFDVSRSFQDSRDGRLYRKVTIGTQTWMAENLAYLPSVNAKSDNSTILAKYYVYDYDGTDVTSAKATSSYSTYGVLYNWTAAMAGAASSTANPSGVKGVCPTGWHLPSSAEWTTLETYVGGSSTAGTKLKSKTGWSVGGDTEADAIGFSALPGGNYNGSGFNYALDIGYWWSAAENGATNAYYRYMYYSSANVVSSSGSKNNGFSVRCLQD